MQQFIKFLQERLQGDLPGADAQHRMAHVVRRTYAPPPSNARKAAVLALFYPKSNEWHLALIQRQATHPNDPHSGQISFPGGKMEKSDPNIEFTARRETQEEIGIQSKDVNIIGTLSDMYIPISNFMVYPFIGYLDYEPTFVPQETEVKSVLEVPFSMLEDTKNVKLREMKFGNNIIMRNVPYFDVNGLVVWGATAMMLSELLDVVGVVTRKI